MYQQPVGAQDRDQGLLSGTKHFVVSRKNPWKIKISGENTINAIILVYPMLAKDWSK